MRSRTGLAELPAGGMLVRRALVVVLPSVAMLTSTGCEDDPEMEEDVDALPTSIGTADIPEGESDAEFVYADTSIEPAQVTLPPQGVVISLRNDGTREHEFVMVDSEDTYAVDELPLVEGSVAIESLTVLGEVGPFPPGETRTVIAELEAGTRYIVFCNLPGHYQAGVRAEIETAGD